MRRDCADGDCRRERRIQCVLGKAEEGRRGSAALTEENAAGCVLGRRAAGSALSARSLRKLLLALVAGLVLALGAGVSVAATSPALRTTGPTSVRGTAATEVFTIGYRTVRQVRYADRGTLRYTFRIANDSTLPVHVSGLGPIGVSPRLFHLLRVTDSAGDHSFTVPAKGSTTATLWLRMTGCRTLSARAGSFVTDVPLTTTTAGVFDHDLTLTLPEQVHTGSPREAFCPEATALSRPPG